jgi:hypothetical protein
MRPTESPDPIQRPFPPDPYGLTDQIVLEGKVYDATIDTIAGYLEDTVHLSKEWSHDRRCCTNEHQQQHGQGAG